ncbi:hypothetical protein [Pedobacter sp. L105]|uniref:hypothetical protein n=1 Tax=Pedobacter sp. L105 TaxID=1641871 RepID=UPI00131D2024|nr:hypothetical protein [Pedobacter sp. L105]
MGITIGSWKQKLVERLDERGIETVLFPSGAFLLLKIPGFDQLVLHLIPMVNDFNAEELIGLQLEYRLNGIQLIQLWEDIWLNRPEQVLSRIFGLLGKNKKIHGRKTVISTVTQTEADYFFDLYHLQGSAKSRNRYALSVDDNIVAMATFSAKRKMTRKREGYTSVELIRFATADGITVQGGLSKLIKHLIRTVLPDDVMTYADLDWSYGKGYAKLGFELKEQTPPLEICLDKEHHIRHFPHRLPDHIPAENYIRIFNTGNLKYILYL